MEAEEAASEGMEVENQHDVDDGYRHNDDDLHDDEEGDFEDPDEEIGGAHSAAAHATAGRSSQQVDNVPLPVGWNV